VGLGRPETCIALWRGSAELSLFVIMSVASGALLVEAEALAFEPCCTRVVGIVSHRTYRFILVAVVRSLIRSDIERSTNSLVEIATRDFVILPCTASQIVARVIALHCFKPQPVPLLGPQGNLAIWR
jgi:hypothetical protein